MYYTEHFFYPSKDQTFERWFPEFSDIIEAAHHSDNIYLLRADGSLWAYETKGSQNSYKLMDDVVSVKANWSNAYVIKKDRSLWVWGRGLRSGSGAVTDDILNEPVKILDNVTMVDPSGLAVTQDGKLYTWGANYGNSGYPDGDLTVSQPSLGEVCYQTTPRYVTDHVVDGVIDDLGSLILKDDGTLWRMTDGTMVKVLDNVRLPQQAPKPSLPQEPEKPSQTEKPNTPDDGFPVNTTGLHSFGAGLAIKQDGSLVSWGTRYMSGNTDSGFSMGHPWNGGETKLDRKYTSISVTQDNPAAVGVTADGTAEIWGLLLEISDVGSRCYPVPIEQLKDVKQAFRSVYTSIYLKNDGTVWRSKRTQTMVEAPERIFSEFSDVVQVANNWEVCYALRADGSLWSYGSGYHYEGGVEADVDFTDPNEQGKPHKIMDDVAYITAGMYNAMAVKKDGTLWGWGYCGNDALGNGGTYDVDTGFTTSMPCIVRPVKIMDDVALVCNGGNFGGAVTPDGKLYTWGMNQHGQLGFLGGDSTYESGSSTIPTQSRPKYVMDDVVDIACGLDVMIVQKKDGSLWAAGSNEQNLTSPNANGQFVKIMDDVKLMVGTPTDTTNPSQPSRPSRPSRPSSSRPSSSSGSSSSTAGKTKDNEGDSSQKSITSKSSTDDENSGSGSEGNSNVTSFPDVASSDYFYGAVQWAVRAGVTAGTSSTAFSPNRTCTRSQVVTFLWRAMGRPEPASMENPFTDIRESDYFYKAVLWAYQNGITSGVNAATFGAEGNCTRGQVAAFLWRANGQPQVSGSNSFTDVSGGDYFADAVSWAVEQGITSGTGNGVFSPNAPCTRAQIVTFLYRSMAD